MRANPISSDQTESPMPQIIQRVRAAFEMKRYDLALDLASDILAQDPDQDEAYYLRGLCFYCLDQYKEAEEMFEKAIQLSPKNDNYLAAMGNTMRCLKKNHQKVQAVLLEALSFNPNNLLALEVLYLLKIKQHRDSSIKKLLNPREKPLEEAQMYLKQLLEIKPDNAHWQI
jgi:tetratricopeptide (TPR) repeat protein